jgi:hypothetical protein
MDLRMIPLFTYTALALNRSRHDDRTRWRYLTRFFTTRDGARNVKQTRWPSCRRRRLLPAAQVNSARRYRGGRAGTHRMHRLILGLPAAANDAWRPVFLASW